MNKTECFSSFIQRAFPHVVYKALQPNTISFNLAISSCSKNLEKIQNNLLAPELGIFLIFLI
jgi:hypothetical protein